MTTMSEAQFQDLADDTLERIHDALEQLLEGGYDGDFDVNLSQGVLNASIPPHGTWVINKQTPNRQIWWSSPVSGPRRYEWDAAAEHWVNTRDGGDLAELLQREIRETTQLELDLEDR
ncbi:hypothetical protein JKP88DRAFT_222642 [Tribonema minus]|uniref:ferroxidase n=1 Tax=Tribonema minus TaxID=303371 RepID=A0A835Z0Y0_9STRA|nr:hypothetical protein JKP88DRAFT_222642 [Tribonema minus]